MGATEIYFRKQEAHLRNDTEFFLNDLGSCSS